MRLGLLLPLVLTSGCLDDNPPPRGADDLGGAGADGELPASAVADQCPVDVDDDMVVYLSTPP